MTYYGYNPPFFGGHQNVMSKQSGDRIIKNDLLQLYLTNKGERVMRPNWGTIIGTSLMEQITDGLLMNLESDIADMTSSVDGRVSVNATATANTDENVVNIKIVAVLTNQPDQRFTMELNLPVANNG